MSTHPLVLLHAFPLDARMWEGLSARLSGDGIRLITPDQRGLGQAKLPDAGREPDLDDAAADVVALLDRLELDRVVLGGCSMGGYVSMAVLRAAPERVAGVVLIDTKASADTDDARDTRLSTASRALAEGHHGWLADNLLPSLVGPTTEAERPEVGTRVRELIEAQPSEGIAWALRAMAARPDSFELLRSTRVPALVVHGEEDRLTGVDEAEAMADALPQGQLAVVPRAGHLSPMEDPDAVAEAIGAAVRGW
ncbi:alpha/beta hydrolase [Haloechinothrix sp. LS1_15]|uniref:alpha/beta fold hydrolase n=1 Tax=Haloechinothrix sp. LS1_15 TaxID=2652248 RepID=UPI0029483E4E|nr:alpha/beta hydrolase [Haloechinothrix sp. LS1_15]MDV6011804.1 alpha/beta fold hydrolase [Haloechinothrix sp. LS1_15]